MKFEEAVSYRGVALNVTITSPILNLDSQIKRPYFHVKPLEKNQLKTWREYLNFELSEGDGNRIIVLFERCMIACALYEEFWTKVCT